MNIVCNNVETCNKQGEELEQCIERQYLLCYVDVEKVCPKLRKVRNETN